MNFLFFCDESYDPPKTKAAKDSPRLEPKCYVVGGFISDQRTWEKVEGRWNGKNRRVGIARYHASHLNAGTWEYEGWSKARRLRYSKHMLKILKDQKQKLHGISCGLYVDSYRKIINEHGQKKMGHPYLVCLKTCIATIAQHMEYGGFAPEDTFSVVIDRNELEVEAIKTFYKIKNDSQFAYRHRLEACTSGASEKQLGLQTADYIAYETFRLMEGKRKGKDEIRHALKTIFGTIGVMGLLLGDKTLESFKERAEETHCEDGGCVIYEHYGWRHGAGEGLDSVIWLHLSNSLIQ